MAGSRLIAAEAATASSSISTSCLTSSVVALHACDVAVVAAAFLEIGAFLAGCGDDVGDVAGALEAPEAAEAAGAAATSKTLTELQ